MDGEKIEDGAYQNDNRKQNHDAPNNPVDENDAIVVEYNPDFVDEPCQSKPPHEGTSHDARIAYEHHEGVSWHYEGQLGKAGHKEKDNEGVGDSHQEGRHPIVDERTFGVAALVHVFSRVGAETVNTEKEEHHASHNLQEKLVVGIVDEIHHKRHTHTCDGGIKQVAHRSSYACHKAIPPTFVKRALYAQYTHRTHRCRGKNTNDDTLKDGAEDVYMK